MSRATLLVLAAGLVGCSDSGGTGPSNEELVGTWHVTKLEFVSVANPGTVVEAISLGATATVVLDLDHSYTITITFPGEATETERGTWSASSDIMTFIRSGTLGQWQFDMILSGKTMLLNGADAEFDFNLDGTDDPAKLNLEMVKP